MTSSDRLTVYGGAFVDELNRTGLQHVVISPGSRSTPLAMLMWANPDLKVWVHPDERSASFLALGIAKAERQPVAILCTSGTAAANYYPAVIEASLARVPLIVLTADRPHELRYVGAPQTIDQTRLYGSHVKWFVDMPLPDTSQSVLRYVRTVAGRAFATALAGPAGPIHLNFPFREPLIPDLHTADLWEGGRESRAPYVRTTHGERRIDLQQVAHIAAELRGTKQGLIVCGPQDDPALPAAVLTLAQTLQYPVLADPLSQVRSGSDNEPLVIDGYDAFLREQAVTTQFAPEVMLRFGAMPVSKAYLRYIEQHPSCRHVIVDDAAGWREPPSLASDMVYTDPVYFCEALTDYLRAQAFDADTWARDWIALNRVTQETVRITGAVDELFEGRAFMELAACLPKCATLYVGNSMPVRDLDTFWMKNNKNIRTMANRGANGIDGVVSSALGASVAGDPLVLVLGDLSFFHDLNGLLIAKRYRLNVTIIIFNNDGGGIFSFLPQAEQSDDFEALFATPTGLDFHHVVAMYGGSFVRVSDWPAFRYAVEESVQTKGLSVIEVPTGRARNVQIHRSIWQEVTDSIRQRIRQK